MPGSPIQAVFFDLDGTLLDHDAATRAGALGLFDRYSDRLTDSNECLLRRWEELTEIHFDRYLRGEATLVGQRRERVRGLFGLTPNELPDAEADQAYAAYTEHYDRNLTLFSDVSDTLEALRSLPLGVITNGGSAHQRLKLVAVGVVDSLTTAVISGEVGVAKPAPEIFRVACEAIGAPPSACVHVGDRLVADAIGARDAGLKGVWLDRHDQGHEPAGVTRITRLTELPPLVLES